MRLEQRIKRLEGQSPVDGDDVSLIAIIGVPTPDEDGNIGPESFFFYCLDKNCPDREHLPLPNETYEAAVARLEDQHQGVARHDTQ